MSRTLLLELGTEEIPARFLPKALEDLRSILTEQLTAAGMAPRLIRTLGTPRRLAALADGLPERQPEGIEVVLGPSAKAAFAPDGAPTKAAEGFARKHGVDPSALETERTEKGDYVAVRKKTGGAPTLDLLSEMLPATVAALSFPKTMRWGEGDFRFVRPLHWIVALLGRDVVPFSVGGIQSDNHSRGHRFVHPGPVRIGSAEDYVDALSLHNVIVDQAERRARIESEVHAWAATVDGVAVHDPALLDRVTHLVELPATVRGEFDPAYLELPREVLVNAMREHQFYLSVEDGKGKLLPYFISVLNVPPKHHETVTRGNERVLRARLADARFFFDEDRKTRLEARVPALRDVLLHQKIGSLLEKVDRLGQLVAPLAEALGESRAVGEAAGRAARLCKADLVTLMVGEFPDLQGVMGREYARLDGESEAVSLAIEEHYRPRHAGAPLPASPAGALLALADRLDALAGCWHAKLIPTATQDPYALRRAALGIIAILQARPAWRLPLDWAVGKACALHGEPDSSGVSDQILEFVRGRLQNHFVSEGHAHDAVEAVLSARLDRKRVTYVPGGDTDFSWDVAGLSARVAVVSEAKREDDFISLATTFRRVVNILPPADQLGGRGELADLEDLKEPSEVRLLDAFNEVRSRAQALAGDRQYRALFAELRKLKAPVDRFFETIRVMDADNPGLRSRRLRLLEAIADLFYEIADFSKIVIEQDSQS